MRTARFHSAKNKGPNPIDLYVGARIKLARKISDVTQEKMAEACNITFQQIQKYESGANRVSASMLVMIANCLGQAPAFFFQGAPEMKRFDVNVVDNVALNVTRLFNGLTAAQQAAVVTLLCGMNSKRVEFVNAGPAPIPVIA